MLAHRALYHKIGGRLDRFPANSFHRRQTKALTLLARAFVVRFSPVIEKVGNACNVPDYLREEGCTLLVDALHNNALA